MPKKKIAAPKPETPAAVQRRIRGPIMPPRERAMRRLHDYSESVQRMREHHPQGEVAALFRQIADLTTQLMSLTMSLPADAGQPPIGFVGLQFGIVPLNRPRYRGLVEPLMVIEEYRDGKLRLAVVQDAAGNKSPGVVLSHLEPWVPAPSATGMPVGAETKPEPSELELP